MFLVPPGRTPGGTGRPMESIMTDNQATAEDLGYGGIKICCSGTNTHCSYVRTERTVSPRVDVRRTGNMLLYTRWICGQRYTFQVGGTPMRPEYVWVWRNGVSLEDIDD